MCRYLPVMRTVIPLAVAVGAALPGLYHVPGATRLSTTGGGRMSAMSPALGASPVRPADPHARRSSHIPPARDLVGLSAPLAPSACPMAHCDPHLSGDEPVVVPTGCVSVAWTFPFSGAVGGASLGCSVGVSFATCIGLRPTPTNARASGDQSYGSQPYMYALDPATGQPLWNSGGTVDGAVGIGAPLIDAAENSYVSDNVHLVSFDMTGAVRWRVPNPAHAAMVSLNMTADGHLVGQGRNSLLVVDPNTGRVTGSLLLTDTIGGVSGTFITLNTVSVRGNRLYTVTQFCPSQGCADPSSTFSQGRLYAVDVVRGVPRVAWHWDFAGPSGASPLTVVDAITPTIYFDGSGQNQGDPHHPWLFAVQDRGRRPALLWAVDFTATYGTPYVHGILAAPLHDPRGGVWVWVTGDSRLFRFDELTGTLLQTIDVSAFPGFSGYMPTGVLCAAVDAQGEPVLFVAAVNGQDPSALTYVNAVDAASGTPIWQLAVGAGADQVFPGQYPLARTPAGPVAIAERKDGLVYGLLLH